MQIVSKKTQRHGGTEEINKQYRDRSLEFGENSTELDTPNSKLCTSVNECPLRRN